MTEQSKYVLFYYLEIIRLIPSAFAALIMLIEHMIGIESWKILFTYTLAHSRNGAPDRFNDQMLPQKCLLSRWNEESTNLWSDEDVFQCTLNPPMRILIDIKCNDDPMRMKNQMIIIYYITIYCFWCIATTCRRISRNYDRHMIPTKKFHWSWCRTGVRPI